MAELSKSKIAIVDYGRGNLFSVKNACDLVGLNGNITSSKEDVLKSDGIILPGVGAFGSAMDELKRLDLVPVLKDAALSLKPFLGICLGMQMLMNKSFEFGVHNGLGLIDGPVKRFEFSTEKKDELFKIPQMGWNSIERVKEGDREKSWEYTILDGLDDRDFMYFVHSFYAEPSDPEVILSKTRYGGVEFCSSLRYRNIYGCQFHPERSGLKGLEIYKNFAKIVKRENDEVEYE